ncbi:MAG: hypothetical protein JWN48_2914 [Myxococcaceae bacterium]|nr:hypothetical protein [Myxococcaceae bacterium]
MVRRMLRSFFPVSSALLLVCAVHARPARAQGVPYDNTVQLGRPLHPVRVTVAAPQAGADVALVSGGKRRVLPVKNASDVALEVVPVGADAAVAIVRMKSDDGSWVGLLGGRAGNELLLFEPVGPTGDPGEQKTRELALSGEPKALRTGIRYEGVSLCGERPAWFDAKRLDEASLTLVAEPLSAALSTLGPAAMGEEQKLAQATVSATAKAPAPPLLNMLAATASSELDQSTLLPRVPRSLVDGDAARGLTLRPGGFVQLRWEGGALPIQRLELELTASAEGAVELLLFDERSVLRATVPAARGASRVAITPPAPLSGRCLALRVGAGQGVELRELYAYTELDREGGVDRLIASLVQDDEDAAAAVELLAKLGPAAADRLAARWPELPARGRRRGLKVLARALPLGGVRQRVLEAAEAEDPELRELAIAVLARGGEPGRVGLRQLSLVPSAAGDRAALALAEHAEELPALLASLATERGPERATVRRALSTAERRDPARARATVTTWLASAPSLSQRASLALSFAGAGDRDFAASLADEAVSGAQTFADRYRLALALAGATPSQRGDAWLAEQGERAEEWMQRALALEALVLRGSGRAAAVAEKAARDPYPRVRAGALQPALAAGQIQTVEAALAHDGWPLVRVEAAHVLASRPESRAQLEQAVGDRSRLVRRAAIDALASGRRAESWPRVRERLGVADESLEVREAAVGFARELCLGAAREDLVKVAKKVLSPDASDEDSQVAVEALRALHDLGGAAAKEGADLVNQEGGPALKKLWDGLPAARCQATPRA